MIYDWLNSFVDRGEQKFGKLPWIIIVSLVLMMAAAVYVRPGTDYVGHGAYFEALSQHPFGPYDNNKLGYRIMTPLISFLVGLRGKPFILTNLFFAVVTIGVVFAYFRKYGKQAGDAMVAATCITFSTVILVTIYYAGFCDALTYLIIFLMWWSRSKPFLFYPLIIIGLFNHESIAFILPWFAYMRWRESPRKGIFIIESIIGYGLVLAAYFLFRNWISSQLSIGFSAGYYFTPLVDDPLHWIRRAYTHYGLGLFSVFKLLWVFPIVAGISMWRNGQRDQALAMLILMACTMSQLLIAYDTTRMLTVGFLVLIVALEYLFKTNPYNFRNWAVWVILLNLAVPQLFTAAKIIEIMRSTPVNLLKMVIENKPWW